ncbi:hypothetical protein MPSEU_001082900 [Mayamaea pseudoterrestris]|nr:hypothetical protein MPSEU_001082900 [Mayamaea pseudoterrestris]
MQKEGYAASKGSSADEDMEDDDLESDESKSAREPIGAAGNSKRLAEVSERSDEAGDGSDSQTKMATLPGNPHISLEQRRLEAKRSYNRMNAARARQRTKQQIEDLSSEVDQYTARNIQLQRLNVELVRQVESLSNENALLRQRLTMSQGAGSLFSPTAAGGSLGVDPSPLSLQQQLAAASNSHLQHQALLQSLSLSNQHSAATGLSDMRSLFPTAQDSSATSSSLASMLAQRDVMEQQRLLFSLGQPAHPSSSYMAGSSSLLDQLTPAQRLLLSESQQGRLGGGASTLLGINPSSAAAAASNDLQTPLLRALLAQQQQRERDASNGPKNDSA